MTDTKTVPWVWMESPDKEQHTRVHPTDKGTILLYKRHGWSTVKQRLIPDVPQRLRRIVVDTTRGVWQRFGSDGTRVWDDEAGGYELEWELLEEGIRNGLT